jgi:hypothetical protein
MNFESPNREDQLKVDIKKGILQLIKEKDYPKSNSDMNKEQITIQLGFIKEHIEELVALVGEEDESVVELKNLFRTNFLAFPIEI